jgi:cell division protein FtsI (penicillin-binding protein 3)
MLLSTLTSRTNFLKLAFYAVISLFIARLFYLQVVRHDYYAVQAANEQQKKFVIKADRGTISARDGDKIVPVVLNENLPTLYVDPSYANDKEVIAAELSKIVEIDKKVVDEALAKKGSYAIIKKRISKVQTDRIKAVIVEKSLKGIGLSDQIYRVYPQGPLAGQIVGFVNFEDKGQYGLEEAYNDKLSGIDGLLKAVTDINGVPLAASNDNIDSPAQKGQNMTLTIDVNTQRQLEDSLREEAVRVGAKGASGVIMDITNGEIVGMANYPSFDPANFDKVSDFKAFGNAVIATAYEPGSVIKILTMAAGLKDGAITPASTYFNNNLTQVEDSKIKNSYNWAPGDMTMTQVLERSLNTGVVWILRQLGGGEINKVAREKLNKSFVGDFGLGSATGIDVPGEVDGTVAGVTTGAGDNVRYANFAFGQGLTVNLLQLAASTGAALNGGNLYTPHLLTTGTTTPKKSGIVSQAVSDELMSMIKVSGKTVGVAKEGYAIGGKTGTAQIASPNGGYRTDVTNDSFVAVIGGATPKYVLVVRISEPSVNAGSSYTSGPLAKKIVDWMVGYYSMAPK